MNRKAAAHGGTAAPPQMDVMELRVRYVESDPMGLVHHSIYPVWFEMGRTELLRKCGMDYRDLEAQDVFLAVVSLSVTYKKPARYDDILHLHTTLKSVGHVKIEHTYELYRGNELLTTGATTLACLNSTQRIQPVPKSLLRCSGNTGEA